MYLTISSRPCASSMVTHVSTFLSGPAAVGLPGGQMSEFLVEVARIALH